MTHPAGSPPHRHGSGAAPAVAAACRHRIAFVLTMQGTLHRFTLLRRMVEQTCNVTAQWLPVFMWKEHDPLRFLPPTLRSHIRSVLEVGAIFCDPHLDAVMFHAYTPHVAYTWYKWLRRLPAISIWYRDSSPLLAPTMADALGLPNPSGLARWFKRRVWSATFARTDLIVARCAFTKQLLVSECGVPTERVHVLHLGVDLDRWPAVTRPPRPRDRRVRLLFVGTDFTRKGGDLLLQVFRQHLADTCELHLVTSRGEVCAARGRGADYELRGAHELGDHVYLYHDIAPESPALQRLYAQADLFVLPTRLDLAPFAILEAMASGLPVVSTAVGGIPELVTEGETGCVVEPDDPAALREALERLIADPQLCLRMGLAARRRVELSFDARANVRTLVDLIGLTIERRSFRKGREHDETNEDGIAA